MYIGVIRHRQIYSLNPTSLLMGDLKFYHKTDMLLPPLFAFTETLYTSCIFVNSFGIFTLKRSSVHKFKDIENIYQIFNTKKFKINFKNDEQNLLFSIQLLKKNKINIDYISFKNLKYNSKNTEYHTNISKDTITIFQALNSTLPYP